MEGSTKVEQEANTVIPEGPPEEAKLNIESIKLEEYKTFAQAVKALKPILVKAENISEISKEMNPWLKS